LVDNAGFLIPEPAIVKIPEDNLPISRRFGVSLMRIFWALFPKPRAVRQEQRGNPDILLTLYDH